MGLETITAVAIGTLVFGASLVKGSSSKKSDEQLIFTGRCRAPSRVVLQCLDTLVNVRMPSAQYPLSRYWLELQEADYQRGSISACLEFVEKVLRNRVLGFQVGPAKAAIKKYGFVWIVEELLVANQVELAISLLWKQLTPGKASRYEELILHTMISLTREIVNRLDQAFVVQAPSPITGPPPIALEANSEPWGSPPPITASGGAPPGSFPPLSAMAANTAKTGKANAQASPASAKSTQGSSGLRKKNNPAFAGMGSKSSQIGREEQSKRLVDWPSPQDFHEAIQNPSSCFQDKFLRNGQPDIDAMGMPRVSSGAFASVYRVRCLDRDRAVRCFLQPVKDQQYRYEVLRDSVHPEQLPWTVEFDYFSQGICVAGQWYPILTMDWVEGTPLNFHVAGLCEARDINAIEQLRQRFNEMANGLREAEVAHGDLQHGNILVQDGQLVLVDYDGMFVPGLSRQKSNELGHANYQHPSRSEQHFNERIDHFSAWVIDTALLCLREDPSLWRFCYDDGESMLFHRQDFIRPENSAILAHLAEHSSAIVKKRARSFRQLLELSLDQIPPLKDALSSYTQAKKNDELPRAPRTKEGKENSSALPDWLDDVD